MKNQQTWEFQRDLAESESHFRDGFEACRYLVLKILKNKENKYYRVDNFRILEQIEKL